VGGLVQTIHIVIITFIKRGILGFKFKLCYKAVTIVTPFLQNMDKLYGATKRPHLYSRAIATIELDDFI
jgi:hypothetical protein